MEGFGYTINHKTLDMKYGYVLTYNPYTSQYAYMDRGYLKYYFGTGTDADKNINDKIGVGSTPEDAIENLNNKSYDKR